MKLFVWQMVKNLNALIRMEDNANIKFKSCSLGMKQRIGIAMALLGDPALLILDEPINGLDTDGMRIMREILVDITKNYGCTVLISSHLLGELEKIATHYGIIRQGKMITLPCYFLYDYIIFNPGSQARYGAVTPPDSLCVPRSQWWRWHRN